MMAGPIPKPAAIKLRAAIVSDQKVTASLPLQLCTFFTDHSDKKA